MFKELSLAGLLGLSVACTRVVPAPPEPERIPESSRGISAQVMGFGENYSTVKLRCVRGEEYELTLEGVGPGYLESYFNKEFMMVRFKGKDKYGNELFQENLEGVREGEINWRDIKAVKLVGE